MAQQTINIGTVANDGTGDPIRDAFDKCNDNFTELYAGLVGLLDFKGATDASGNPNYPAASKGDFYLVSVAGKVGGASGTSVEAGDAYFATADNAGGTQAAVGTSWTVIQGNVTYAPVNKAGDTMTGDLVVPDEAYDATAWNGSLEVPTKNAVRDKIESLAAGSYTPGGTDVALADGGTGASLTDPNADRILFWDDSAGAVTWLTVSTGLNITGTNLTATATAPTESIIIACSDESTAITTGTAKATFRMPYAFTLTAVRASVTTAPTGSTILIDINESGTTILSTKLMIDASEKTSTTAATPAVISDSSLADDAEITIDFDQVGSTIAGAGVKVYLIGVRA